MMAPSGGSNWWPPIDGSKLQVMAQ